MAIGKLAPTMRHALSMYRLASTSCTCQSAGGVLISMRVSGKFFIRQHTVRVNAPLWAYRKAFQSLPGVV